MAQVVKSLLYKDEGPDSDPQDPCKGMVTCGYNPSNSRTGQAVSRSTREPPRPSVSLASLRDCVKKKKKPRWRDIEGDGWHQPLTSMLTPHTHSDSHVCTGKECLLCHLTKTDSSPQENCSVFSPCYIKQYSLFNSYYCENIKVV